MQQDQVTPLDESSGLPQGLDEARHTRSAVNDGKGSAGFELAEAFDLRLRNQELKEREERLALLRLAEDSDAEAPERADALELRRLESENHLLREFYVAVLGSRSWKLMQWARGFLGRRW